MRRQGPIANMAHARTPKFQTNASTIESIASYLGYIAIMGRKHAGIP